MPYTEQDCIDALQDAAATLGESPSKRQYEQLKSTPAANSILRVMGSWNGAKEAAGLELLEPGDRSNTPIQPKPDGVELPDGYEWDELNPQQQWYYKNREHRISVKERRRKSLQRWLYEYKRDLCNCERCGEGSPPCLDFHHVDEKGENISQMVNSGYSIEKVLEEIDRCIVLCANCHQRAHHPLSSTQVSEPQDGHSQKVANEIGHTERREPIFEEKRERRAELRQWVFDLKRREGGCRRCDEADPICLEFHHEDGSTKSMSIAESTVYHPSKEELLEEIDNCEILCRNCHRQEHFETPEVDDFWTLF